MDNANQLSLTHQMAQMIVSTRFDDFSEENVKVAKRFLLDTLAVSWAGSDAPGCQEAYALSVSEGGRVRPHSHSVHTLLGSLAHRNPPKKLPRYPTGNVWRL
ncbi:MAG: hypothetical protein WCH96_09195 [Betaproteobacteria bacterium]